MVAAAVVRPSQGLLPFDPLRHLGGVSELLFQSFAAELGPGGHYLLRRMRRAARWGGLGLLLWGVDALALGPTGFVWVEGSRVVGNVSVRRAAAPGGWLVGNVAVHPDWRRQGIGRALMEAAVDMSREESAAWVGLEVRDDSLPAARLYAGMGFETVGSMVELSRPAGAAWPQRGSAPLPLRRAGSTDNSALYRLARLGLGDLQQEVLEMRPSLYRVGWESWLDSWLGGSREDWWLAAEDGERGGALHISSRRAARWHQLELLPGQQATAEQEERLVAAGLALLARRQRWEVTCALTGWRESLEPLLIEAGFRRLRCLWQMRMRVGGRR